MNKHKKSAGSVVYYQIEGSGKPRSNNRTTARACTIILRFPTGLYNDSMETSQLTYTKRKHLLSIIPLLKNLPDFLFGIIFVKCLQYYIEFPNRGTLSAAESLQR